LIVVAKRTFHDVTASPIDKQKRGCETHFPLYHNSAGE
jgi:hypothetical protein